jgi:hypothetical protein
VITHVVLMKFKPENKDGIIAEALTRLNGMFGRVPSLRALEAGKHVGAPDRAFDVGLVTRFDDLAGLSAYATDPVHVAVKQWLGLHLETAVVVDFASAT